MARRLRRSAALRSALALAGGLGWALAGAPPALGHGPAALSAGVAGAGSARAEWLDLRSLRCLRCHPEAADGSGGAGTESSASDHPVGSDYAEAQRSRPSSLQPLDRLSRRVALPEGRVTCVSCHVPKSGTQSPPEGACPESEGLIASPRTLCSQCHSI